MLEARKLGQVRLVTDSVGARFVERLGLEPFYNGGISTTLDRVPQVIPPRVFWSAGKLFALRETEGACVSLDCDAILWRPLSRGLKAAALHSECTEWVYYRRNRERYERFGFGGSEWDWETPPYNAGIVFLRDPAGASAYGETAVRFMHDFGRWLARHGESGAAVEDHQDAMLFAEQRLLPMVLATRGVRLTALGELHPCAPQLRRNARCTHLWFSKRWYDACAEARRAYCRHLEQHVARRHPEADALIQRWRRETDAPGHAASRAVTRGNSTPEGFERSFCLLEDIRGTVRIADANVNAVRPAERGAMVFAAEGLQASPGSEYRLLAGGRCAVRLRHRPVNRNKPESTRDH